MILPSLHSIAGGDERERERERKRERKRERERERERERVHFAAWHDGEIARRRGVGGGGGVDSLYC